MWLKVEFNSSIAQMWIVEGVEGIESVGVLFRATVAAQKSSIEEDTHFGNNCVALIVVCGSKLNTCEQIFLSIGAQLSYWQL